MRHAAGATHGGDESWLLRKQTTATQAEHELSVDMANWWTTLGATLDPNGNRSAPRWTTYVPGTADMTMFLDAPPRKPLIVLGYVASVCSCSGSRYHDSYLSYHSSA